MVSLSAVWVTYQHSVSTQKETKMEWAWDGNRERADSQTMKSLQKQCSQDPHDDSKNCNYSQCAVVQRAAVKAENPEME